MSKELAVKQEAGLPDYLRDEAAMNMGSDYSQDELSLGWLRIAQSQTEAAVEGSEGYIPGLRPGMFFNTLTREVYGNDCKVIVLKFFKSYSENTAGSPGEFVRGIEADEYEDIIAEVGKNFPITLGNGNVVKELWNYWVALPDHPEAGFLRFAMSPGSFKAARLWNSCQMLKKVPSYCQIWELHSKFNKGDKGNFYSIGLDGRFTGDFAGFVPQEDLIAIREMADFLSANHDQVKAKAKPVGDDY